ncbi:MAG: hypothetical protein CM1200mP28_15750 [Deltaproteobacteria bacterium]|nr:MAG: hypothetical protein CM1200mP28_15750 [Deltaproteobacteria bacterium]
MSIPPSRFYDYIMLFGFGQKPNSGFVAEASGRVISPKKWKSIDHATISFGRAHTCFAIANGKCSQRFCKSGRVDSTIYP